ncbi:DUF4229 domain-containing protein [Schumannella soli]|uniref:DUF4229 domain-containing protein n=1 Tax=Schumannella soli TaxID=2590779 RepID=A0A506XN97_9MICO|nr:DUF4229 domain-containing protein [Schumannella soli]TPW74124.1 DUF4229 domain-containing protein [Schumannella soli]
MPAWLRYALIRVGVFALVFAVLLLLGFHYLWAGLIAAVVGFCVGVIFFRGQRDAVATQLANRKPRRATDESVEDDAEDDVEDAAGPASEAAATPASDAATAPASEGDRRGERQPEGE